MALSEYWQRLPQRTRRALLVGSVGPDHLDEAAAFAAGEGAHQLALELQLAAWEHYPLDGVFAAKVLERAKAVEEGVLEIPETLLRAVITSWRLPTDGEEAEKGLPLEHLAKNREYEQAFACACDALKTDGHNLFWCEQTVILGMMTGQGREASERVLRAQVLQQDAFAPMADFLRGEFLFVAGEYTAAKDAYLQAMNHPLARGWQAPLERCAEACWRLEWRDEAMEYWKQAIEKRPWHTNLLLRAHAAVLPVEELMQFASTAVLVYSYNKADYLDATLAALAESRGASLIIALDNGSTDATPDVLASWRDRLGCECLKTLRLPVNVGAPAARNWLAAMSELDEMEYVAYLDDDALPPPDWLELLHAARQTCPEAAVWGCRVMDHKAPEIIQSADMHLQLPTDEDGAPRVLFDPHCASMEPFHISELHAQVSDRGQFDYIRPCASVTGCCHLMQTDSLRGMGFDLRYTPSQYDDLDRDLRNAMEGRFCCYQGGLAVHHRKRSGRAASMNNQAKGNWLGNRYKLVNRFSAEELVALWHAEGRLLADDLMRKIAVLEQVMGIHDLAERL